MPEYRDFQPTLRYAPTLALSPDGSMVAYADDANGQFNVVVRSVDGTGPERRLTSYTDSTVRWLDWHPDGKSLFFLADTDGDEYRQLYRVPLDGGEPEPLTDAPAVQFDAAMGPPCSPDGRLLAYAGNDRVPQDQDVLLRDLDTGETRRLPADGGRMQPGYWAPDGRRLTAAQWRTGTDVVLYVLPVDGGPAVRLIPEDRVRTYWLGPWLPDGSGFLVLTDADREFTGLAVMDPETGELSWWDTPDRDIEDLALSADGRVLVWLVNEDGVDRLRGRDLSTGADLPMPDLPAGAAGELHLSADGRLAVLRISTATRPANIAVVDLDGGELRWLTEAVPGGVDPSTLVEPTLVACPSPEGHSVPAWLYRPVGASGPVGVVLSIHGGPTWQERPAYLHDGFYQYLVDRGVAVLAPNVRGSTGYGRTYQEAINRDWGGVDLRDFAAVATWLQQQDWVDPARIAVFGGSYGGFAVLTCLSRLPELGWAAGVDLFGISNLITLANSSPPTWRTLVATRIGDPDRDAAQLITRSPITHADRIRAPLMVIQGANDPRVPPAESEQIVGRLRDRGVEVRYETFPDEGHGFTKRENQIRAFTAAGDFLLHHIGGR